jgi:hypothetical protein
VEAKQKERSDKKAARNPKAAAGSETKEAPKKEEENSGIHPARLAMLSSQKRY